MIKTRQSAAPLSETICRVALYARVSTVNGNQDPEMQLAELREYTRRRGLTIYEEYVDQGVSGSKESRPALNRMMIGARRREFDAVLVWKIDRLGRSLKHLVVTLADLNTLGVAFISLRDNLDLSTPSGRLMFQIIGAMAEFERALIQERVKAGLRNAKAKGKRIGRPRQSDVHVNMSMLARFWNLEAKDYLGGTFPEILSSAWVPCIALLLSLADKIRMDKKAQNRHQQIPNRKSAKNAFSRDTSSPFQAAKLCINGLV